MTGIHKSQEQTPRFINNATITPGLLNESILNADGTDIALQLAHKYISAFEDAKGGILHSKPKVVYTFKGNIPQKI